ncbi:MAG: hypothetical protein JNL28_08655 [Planctomycetes bacterium]|nr:hypothetical protein [Planctomycetota bacterium]
MRTLAKALLSLPALLFLLSPTARAGGQEPSSLLIYPEFDNRPGQISILTVTNTNGDTVNGSVRVHFVYVDSATCLETNLLLTLTPRDTVTFLSSVHAANMQRGYAYGWAVHPQTGKAIDFDHLIGSLGRVDGVSIFDWSVQALAFQGRPGAGLNTDVNNNGKPDLDGIEYDKAPNKIYLPRFFGQFPEPAPRNLPLADLILFRPLGPTGSTTTTAFLIWNDNEEVYSASYSFSCWTRVRLFSISGAFGQTFLSFTNHAPNEVLGMPTTESGWFEVRGQVATSSTGQQTPNPAIFGLLVEHRPNSCADLPFVERQP